MAEWENGWQANLALEPFNHFPIQPFQPFGRENRRVECRYYGGVSCLQTLGDPEQFQPISRWQLELQPSPSVVLPSSQVSLPPTTPSPHRISHWLGWPWQEYPFSMWQAASQPSPLLVLPSSQVSPSLGSTKPLPQRSSVRWMAELCEACDAWSAFTFVQSRGK